MKFIFIILTTLFVGVFLFTGRASAISEPRETGQSVLVLSSLSVDASALGPLEEKTFLQEVDQVKAELEESIQKTKKEIAELKAKLAAKKAEEARLAEVARIVIQQNAVRYVNVNNTAGNTYTYGTCTWYVKNRRPNIPNMLGNANAWLYNARTAGLPTGSIPKPGAVGATSAGYLGHVVYVEAVNADGTVRISEMNAPYWGQVTYRTVHASEFLYVY